MFNARWVDEQHKSRYVVKNFANTRDPKMFAAVSDTAVGRVVEFKAVLQNNSVFPFDATPAETHAWEDVFFWNRQRRRLSNTVIVCGGRSE